MRHINTQRTGTVVLVAGSILVGVAIELSGSAGRLVNGIGGITWFAATGLLVVAARGTATHRWQWPAMLGLTAMVAFVVKPSDLLLAIVGLGGAGLAAGLIAKRDPMLWATLVPALYLPAHIGTAILKAAARQALGMEATIRTDPPPTAALVPVVIVVAAMAGGLVATLIAQRRDDRTRRLDRVPSS